MAGEELSAAAAATRGARKRTPSAEERRRDAGVLPAGVRKDARTISPFVAALLALKAGVGPWSTSTGSATLALQHLVTRKTPTGSTRPKNPIRGFSEVEDSPHQRQRKTLIGGRVARDPRSGVFRSREDRRWPRQSQRGPSVCTSLS